jgi:hypothetical protein
MCHTMCKQFPAHLLGIVLLSYVHLMVKPIGTFCEAPPTDDLVFKVGVRVRTCMHTCVRVRVCVMT